MGPSLNPDGLLMLFPILYNGYSIKFLVANDAEGAVLFRVHENVSLAPDLACMLVATNAGQHCVGVQVNCCPYVNFNCDLLHNKSY